MKTVFNLQSNTYSRVTDDRAQKMVDSHKWVYCSKKDENGISRLANKEVVDA